MNSASGYLANVYLDNVYFVLPPTFANNRSNFGFTSASCFPLSAFIHTEEK